MKLDPVLAEEVKKKLGRSSLPPPNSDEFKELLAYLLDHDPETGELLQSALYSEQLGDIEIEARKHAKRDHRQRRVRQILFERHDDITGEWHSSKTKMLGWFTAASLVAIWFLFGSSSLLMRSGEETEAAVEQAPSSQVETARTPQPQSNDPFTDVADQIAADDRATDAFANASPPTTGNTEPMLQPVGQSGSGGTGSEGERAGESESPVLSEDPMLLSSDDPMLPSTEEDAGLAVFNREGGNGGDLRAYRAGQSQAGGQSGESGDPFAEDGSSSAQASAVGLSVYQRPQPQEEQVVTALRVFHAGALKAQPLVYAPPEQPGSGPATVPSQAEFAPDVPSDARAQAPQAGAQNVLQTQRVEVNPERPEPYPTGSTFDAQLQLGVVAIDDTPLPVLAQANDGSIWSGQATLTPTGRVDIRFFEVLAATRPYPVSAIAQAEDGYLGLQAQVQETTPSLASDLARGALRGVSEHVQALGSESDVSITNGATIINRDAPPIEANVAGSIARLFTPPEGDNQQALVRLAQVPAQSTLKIVVLSEASSSSNPLGE